jgi:ELWxxDGT repeat protein
LTVFNGALYFTAWDPNVGNFAEELWKTDGTAAGTQLVKGIDTIPGAVDIGLSNFTVSGGKLVFTAADAEHGNELWVTDGTTDGTKMVKDINPGSPDSFAIDLTPFNGSLYFRADDGTHGAEMWKTDGTTGGTKMVKDTYPGGDSGKPYQFAILKGSLYFWATDEAHGRELWTSDGTTAGTHMLKDITPGPATSCIDVGIVEPICTDLTPAGDNLYFLASDGLENYELWTTDGTPEGTGPVAGGVGNAIVDPSDLAVMNGSVYFVQGNDLWRTYSGPAPSSARSSSDKKAPQTKITRHPKKSVRLKGASAKTLFAFAASERGAHFTCRLDKGKWASCRSPKTYKVKPGKHTFRVRATDKAGNTDGTPAIWNWKAKRAT